MKNTETHIKYPATAHTSVQRARFRMTVKNHPSAFGAKFQTTPTGITVIKNEKDN